jgi:hypothetical protein
MPNGNVGSGQTGKITYLYLKGLIPNISQKSRLARANAESRNTPVEDVARHNPTGQRILTRSRNR